jgi:hypothetical protein
MPVCDGCGTRTDEAHILRRDERQKLSARFRPAHIKVLFLDAAPPARPEDFFYRPATDRAVRSLASCMYFDELAKCGEVFSSSGIAEEVTLGEFRGRGLFLAHAVECPLEDLDDPQNAIRRFAPTVIKRVQTLLEPSYIVPLSQPIGELIRLFGLVGWGDRLVLDNGGPFVDPYLGDPKKQTTFNSGFGERIQKILAKLP